MNFDITVNHRPKSCPKCGSPKIADIMYGMPRPDQDLEEKLKSGQIILGGCCQPIGSPMWQCAECETPFYLEEDVIRAKELYEEFGEK